MKPKIAVFPGSFDPFTLGHEDIVTRALPLFDKIIIGVGVNSLKQAMFSSDQRVAWIREIFRDEKKVEVQTYSGLTVDFCRRSEARFILRGIRSAADLAFESPVAQMNRQLDEDIDSVFLITSPQFAAISSTIVRDILRNQGDASRFLPAAVKVK